MKNWDKTTKKRERSKRGAHIWLPLLFIVLLVSFCYSTYKLTDGLIAVKKERDAFRELSEIIAQSTPRSEAENDRNKIPVGEDDAGNYGKEAEKSNSTREADKWNSATEVNEATFESFKEKTPLSQYLPLYERNSDFFGWLSVEGTEIDFPVMYAPDRPEYYLTHAFDGSKSRSGVPFVDSRCATEGNYFLIYGHHMNNRTMPMFGQLLQYVDPAYYSEHSVIRFDTLYERRDYQVIAVFYSRVYDKSETDVFRYYEYFDLSEEAVFEEYRKEVQAAAIYDTGIDVAFGDELLTLSTCNSHTTNGRFVVVAKKIDRME